MSNRLIGEKSPYLKQHAHNPVDWFPWDDTALDKAQSENKLLIVSIGYSACHWCHVMERESFENEIIAQTMNKFFVSIKVDREERPDIDQIYMLAVQLMTNSGGWPLNVICLPDGRPIYGGTYFKPKDWQNILLQIAQMWEETPSVALEYAAKLANGIERAERLPIREVPEAYTLKDLQEIVNPWKEQFDSEWGGYLRTPKFPLPNNWIFLLRYATLAKDQQVLDHVHFTLERMADGGIYDHLGGGFARYSVDGQWQIPHFEKMLSDNGQLLSLYSEAYQQSPNIKYHRVIVETISWLQDEMLAPNGGFYSAIDADSEGVEGRFYSFLEEEFALLGSEAEAIKTYFNVSQAGNWSEESTNILHVTPESEQQLKELQYSDEDILQAKKNLLAYRNQRIHPHIDDKQLVSWNALTITGLCDAYRALGNKDFLALAKNAMHFILDQCLQKDGILLHQPANENRTIEGFLDDYAFTVEALIRLYECSFDEEWLYQAEKLAQTVFVNFYDKEQELFFYTSIFGKQLIARKAEIMDNVIPSSSSTWIRQLYKLGVLMDKTAWLDLAEKIVANVAPTIKSYGSAYSNWATQLLEYVFGTYEVALVGSAAAEWRTELDQYYIPNKITLGGTKSSLPLLLNRQGLDSKAYLCHNRTCSLPLDSVASVLKLINNEAESL